jgi:hypothetical protein
MPAETNLEYFIHTCIHTCICTYIHLYVWTYIHTKFSFGQKTFLSRSTFVYSSPYQDFHVGMSPRWIFSGRSTPLRARKNRSSSFSPSTCCTYLRWGAIKGGKPKPWATLAHQDCSKPLPGTTFNFFPFSSYICFTYTFCFAYYKVCA